MSVHKIESFDLSLNETYIFAGNYFGEVLTIDPITFTIIKRFMYHDGSIHKISTHEKLPYIATLGMDGNISLIKYDVYGNTSLIHNICSRNIRPEHDQYINGYTTTQLLTFHPTLPKLIGHGGSAAIFEVEFTDETFNILHCCRFLEPYDWITAKYVMNSDSFLLGNNRGIVLLIENWNISRQWDFGINNNTQAVHWFEEVSTNIYLVASDARRVFLLDITDDNNYVEGEIIAMDHLEHVHYNSHTGKAYTSGFDRKIYQIDIDNCSIIDIVWEAPFKIRWIKTLYSDPEHMIVNCRNGILYKITINNHNNYVVSQINEEVHAMWSAAICNKNIIIGGEGRSHYKLTPSKINLYNNAQEYDISKIELDDDNNSYTKRIMGSDSIAIIARSNGNIFLNQNDNNTLIFSNEYPVRDICISKDLSTVYIASEDGSAYAVYIHTRVVVQLIKTNTPIWAIAINDDNSVLCVANRIEKFYLIDLKNNHITEKNVGLRFVKRVKFVNNNELLLGSGGSLKKYNINEDLIENCINNTENSIEDFFITEDSQYLVVLNYAKVLHLYDYHTYELLFTQSVGHDYGKGIMLLNGNLNNSGYKKDFILYGRDGGFSYMRIHDEMILTLYNSHLTLK